MSLPQSAALDLMAPKVQEMVRLTLKYICVFRLRMSRDVWEMTQFYNLFWNNSHFRMSENLSLSMLGVLGGGVDFSISQTSSPHWPLQKKKAPKLADGAGGGNDTYQVTCGPFTGTLTRLSYLGVGRVSGGPTVCLWHVRFSDQIICDADLEISPLSRSKPSSYQISQAKS